MKNKMIFFGSILAILILAVPILSAVELKTGEKSVENVKTLDEEDREIITLIRGHPDQMEVLRSGIIREVIITARVGINSISLHGWKFSGGILPEGFIVDQAKYVKAYRFIGFYRDGGPTDHNDVVGIALGDIEWR